MSTFATIGPVYQTFRKILPSDLQELVLLDLLINVEEAISKPIELERDRDAIQDQWRVVINTLAVVNVYQKNLKLQVTRMAADIELKTRAEASAKAEKITADHMKSIIASDSGLNRILATYDYVASFAEHLAELRQLLWTRKDNIRDQSADARDHRRDDFYSRHTG